MKRIFLTPFLAVPAAILIFVSLILPANAAEHTIIMKSISFDPKSTEIKIGDSVQWTNKSLTEHSATRVDGSSPEDNFDTGRVLPSKTSRKFLFKKEGRYDYQCTVHGKTMSGKIVVTK